MDVDDVDVGGGMSLGGGGKSIHVRQDYVIPPMKSGLIIDRILFNELRNARISRSEVVVGPYEDDEEPQHGFIGDLGANYLSDGETFCLSSTLDRVLTTSCHLSHGVSTEVCLEPYKYSVSSIK